MIGIAPYRITVLNEKGTTTPLWLPDGSSGLSHWLYDTLLGFLGEVRKHGELRRSRVRRVSRNAGGDLVTGSIQTGVNGFSSELVNTNTGFVSHHRQVIEAEFIPFFFLSLCPVGQDFGILLLERFGNMGVKDFFVQPLLEKFSEDHPGSRLRITRLVPSDLANQLLNDSLIKTVRLVKYEEPEDVADSLGHGYAESVGVVEMVFKAKRNGKLPMIDGLIAALKGKKAIGAVYSVDGFEYDTIKVDVEINGKRRTIDVGRPNVLTPNIDITEEIELGIDGHALLNSLVERFLEFADDTLNDEGVDWDIDSQIVEDNIAPDIQEQVAQN